MTPLTKDLLDLLRTYSPSDEHIIYDLLSLGWGYNKLIELGFDSDMIERVSNIEMTGGEL
jgi:hypothetical protein